MPLRSIRATVAPFVAAVQHRRGRTVVARISASVIRETKRHGTHGIHGTHARDQSKAPPIPGSGAIKLRRPLPVACRPGMTGLRVGRALRGAGFRTRLPSRVVRACFRQRPPGTPARSSGLPVADPRRPASPSRAQSRLWAGMAVAARRHFAPGVERAGFLKTLLLRLFVRLAQGLLFSGRVGNEVSAGSAHGVPPGGVPGIWSPYATLRCRGSAPAGAPVSTLLVVYSGRLPPAAGRVAGREFRKPGQGRSPAWPAPRKVAGMSFFRQRNNRQGFEDP